MKFVKYLAFILSIIFISDYSFQTSNPCAHKLASSVIKRAAPAIEPYIQLVRYFVKIMLCMIIITLCFKLRSSLQLTLYVPGVPSEPDNSKRANLVLKLSAYHSKLNQYPAIICQRRVLFGNKSTI